MNAFAQENAPSFGEWVRTRRRALDLTQGELAQLANCARVTIRKVESDELLPSKELAQVLADKLGVPTSERDNFVAYARSGKHPEALPVPSSVAAPWRDETPRHNLPAQLTNFIGREQEIEQVKELLTRTRLVTLSGSGGVGKTRLAMQVGASLADAPSSEGEPRLYPDGVWFIELAPLSDPFLVPNTIANVLGVREEQGRPLMATLSDWLRSRKLLFILDNCEHLIDACAKFTQAVLQASSHVRILASSREALGIIGESEYRLPSLEIPNPKEQIPIEQLMRYGAVKLFVERATQSLSTFNMTDANAPQIAQICARLDGIPLAIELAAARVKALSVEKISERLDDRFRLLTGGSRTALPRQQTLRALIDWSYNLLSEPERVLLRRLSVFAGGWTLEAAEKVCSSQASVASSQKNLTTDDWLLATDILDLLARLVDKSLVVANLTGKEPRYHLLETIRQYARDKLLDANETQSVRDQHLDLFMALAEEAEPILMTAQRIEWMPRLEVEHDNFRAALEWACERDPDKARWLAGLLCFFWTLGDHLGDARAWYTRVLGLTESKKTKAMAIALLGSGIINKNSYLIFQARPLLEQSAALWRELGDQRRLAQCVWNSAHAAVLLGQHSNACAIFEENESLIRNSSDSYNLALALTNWAGAIAGTRSNFAAAKKLLEEAIALGWELDDAYLLGATFDTFGNLAMLQGDFDLSRQYHAESLTWRQKSGTRWIIAIAMRNVADALSLQGDYQQAQSFYDQALSLQRAIGDQLGGAVTEYRLGCALVHHAQFDQATELFVTNLELLLARSAHSSVASCLAGIAELRRLQGLAEPATRILSFVEIFLKSNQRSFSLPSARIDYERSVASVRAELDEAIFNTAWDAGSKMTLEQAIELALQEKKVG